MAKRKTPPAPLRLATEQDEIRQHSEAYCKERDRERSREKIVALVKMIAFNKREECWGDTPDPHRFPDCPAADECYKAAFVDGLRGHSPDAYDPLHCMRALLNWGWGPQIADEIMAEYEDKDQ